MIRSALLTLALAFALPAQASLDDAPVLLGVRPASLQCSDALTRVAIAETERGPRLLLVFEPGYERCEDQLMDIEPIVHRGEHCLALRFVTGHAIFCVPASMEI